MLRANKLATPVFLVSLFSASLAHAHHSFAVHFEAEANKEVKGVVENFKFANPHGSRIRTAC
jgi:hypothetical protein